MSLSVQPTPDMVEVRHEEFRVDDEVRNLFRTLTNELHANSVAVGRLIGEVGRFGERLVNLEARVGVMREQLESVPDAAGDTAKHEVEKLRQELERREAEELRTQLQARRDSQRVAADRRWQLAIQAGALIVASALSGLAVHLWHVLGK